MSKCYCWPGFEPSILHMKSSCITAKFICSYYLKGIMWVTINHARLRTQWLSKSLIKRHELNYSSLVRNGATFLISEISFLIPPKTPVLRTFFSISKQEFRNMTIFVLNSFFLSKQIVLKIETRCEEFKISDPKQKRDVR